MSWGSVARHFYGEDAPPKKPSKSKKHRTRAERVKTITRLRKVAAQLRDLGATTGTHLRGYSTEQGRRFIPRKSVCGMLVRYVKLTKRGTKPTCPVCLQHGWKR